MAHHNKPEGIDPIAKSYIVEDALTPTQERAAILLAENQKTEQDIADELGIHRNTLLGWKRKPLFEARILQHRGEVAKALSQFSITTAVERIRGLQLIWDKGLTLIKERAEAYDGLTPGGGTGLLVKDEKILSGGGTVEVFKTDNAFLKELRETLKQAAIESGQWSIAGVPTQEAHVITDDDIERAVDGILKVVAGGSAGGSDSEVREAEGPC